MAEEKRVWYEEHPGEVHPSDVVPAPEPVSTEPDFFTSSLNALSSISIPLPSSSYFVGEEKKAAAGEAEDPATSKPVPPPSEPEGKEPIVLIRVEDAAQKSPEVHGH